MALFLITHNFKTVQRRVNPNQQVPQGGITRMYYIAVTQSDRFLCTQYRNIGCRSIQARSKGRGAAPHPTFFNWTFF